MHLPFLVPLRHSQKWVRGRQTRKEGQHEAGSCLRAPHLSPAPKTMRAESISSFIHIPCICVSGICATSKLLPHLKEKGTLSFIPEAARSLEPLTYFIHIKTKRDQ